LQSLNIIKFIVAKAPLLNSITKNVERRTSNRESMNNHLVKMEGFGKEFVERVLGKDDAAVAALGNKTKEEIFKVKRNVVENVHGAH
jgi:hypothetical protein